jgi:hypothetical protein
VELMVKQYFIPTADFANVIEVDAAAGVGVAPTTPGTYRAIAGVLAADPLTVSAPPSFTARGAAFDGSTYYSNDAISVAAGTQGIMSLWFQNRRAVWNTPAGDRVIFFQVGGTTAIELSIASSGRMTFGLYQDGTGSDTWTSPTSTFAVNTWYHILWAWDWAASRFQIYINGVAQTTSGYSFSGATKFIMSGDNLTRIGVGTRTAGASVMLGDIGHFFLDTNSTLDLSVTANREKFVLAGAPVDLGADGSTPLGAQPEYYYDGAGSAWDNQGTAGTVAVTGALTASSTAPSY